MDSRGARIASPLAAYGAFLYAGLGDDDNGVSLTVLSAFARQDVDPWEQAATLSRLPAASAQTQLVAMLGALPGQRSLAHRIEIAGRLIPLLPRHTRPGSAAGGKIQQLLMGEGSAKRGEFTMILLYLVSMILAMWIYSGVTAKPPAGSGAENPAQVSTKSP